MDREFIFPFGSLAAIISTTVLLVVLLLKHPLNFTGQVTIAEYLFSMGLLSLAILFGFRNFDSTSLGRAEYSIPGFIISFLLGMGLLAFARSTVFSAVDTSFIASLSVAGLPDELFMLFVATVEELMFRLAIPVFLSKTFLIMLPREAKWLGAVIISSAAFGLWHVFAYAASADMMFLAAIAGVIFSIAFRVGALLGAGDMAFAGIIAGHYFWNLTAAGVPSALPSVLLFSLLVVSFVVLVNPQTNKSVMMHVNGLWRMVAR